MNIGTDMKDMIDLRKVGISTTKSPTDKTDENIFSKYWSCLYKCAAGISL